MAFFLENFMKYKNMDELRKELDLLDNDLIKLVSKRFKFIEEAAIIKDDVSKIIDNDISPDIVEKLCRFIIELSIELETEIFNKK